MGLCKTSNVSIFTFINAIDLKFCTLSYSSCVYRMTRFRGLNGKVCKMTSHFRTLIVLCLFSYPEYRGLYYFTCNVYISIFYIIIADSSSVTFGSLDF